MFKLPAGLIWEGELHREFELGPMTGAVRREMLSAQGRKGEAHKLRRKILKRVLAKLGPFEPVTDEQLLALPFCDTEYILYKLAESLRGDKPFRAEGFCQECLNRGSYLVEWSEIQTRMIEDTDFTQDRKLKFALKKGLKNQRTGVVGKYGHLKLYTLGDFENFLRTQINVVKGPSDLDPGRIEAGLILAMLDSIEGFDKSEDGDFTVEDLDRLDLADYEILAQALKDQEPGVVFPTRTCENCQDGEVRLSADWVNDFLLRLRS